jgi:hypothetical protein
MGRLIHSPGHGVPEGASRVRVYGVLA